VVVSVEHEIRFFDFIGQDLIDFDQVFLWDCSAVAKKERRVLDNIVEGAPNA